jgi:hypothetical protein
VVGDSIADLPLYASVADKSDNKKDAEIDWNGYVEPTNILDNKTDMRYGREFSSVKKMRCDWIYVRKIWFMKEVLELPDICEKDMVTKEAFSSYR